METGSSENPDQELPDHPGPGITTRVKQFIEFCGRHPFATGLFALLGIVGLVLSIQGYILDRSESRQTTKDIISVSDSLSMINKRLIEDNSALKDENIDVPVTINLQGKYIDNIVFNASNRVVKKVMNTSEAESVMRNIMKSEEYSTYDPFYSFSVSSIANKNFVQIAPYLLIDVYNVRRIEDQLAGFYFGERGGSAVLREFSATIFPKEGIQVAPMINTMKRSYVDDVDYLSLEPGEVEEFMLYLDYMPGYYYNFRIGIQIKFNGINSVVWDANNFHRGIPVEEIPIYGFTSNTFNKKYHPDVEWVAEVDDYIDVIHKEINEDIAAYDRSRVFKLHMVDMEGPVTPVK